MAYIQDWGMRVQAQPQINTTRRAFLYLSQNENGRMLNIRITDVNIPSGSTAVLAGTKPDGTVYSQTGTLAGNTATFAEDVQMTAVAGTWDAKITVTNGGNCICTARITITIDPDTVAGGAVPSDSQLDGIIAECRAIADSVRKEAYGSPLVADAVEDMTDQSRVYVYTGSETGYTSGHWYYYNGSAWTDGGVYNAVAVDTDTTLSIAGKAADAKKVGDELISVKEDFNNMVNSAYVTDSANGSVAHFVDGADNVPMKSVKVNIAPVQSGSGDPSPSNVRAISGWNSVNVYVSPTTDSEDATVYNISLSSAGTVYGGTLDASSGELTVDKKKFTIDGSNYALGVLSNVYNNRYCYRNTYLGGIIEKNLPSETTKACCNILKSISRSNATSAPNGIFQYHGDNDELRFLFPLEDAYSTPDNIYALGLECCIPLATPLTYQLSATEIKSLLGINNVWSDAGDMDVQYRADTKLYIDKKLGV